MPSSSTKKTSNDRKDNELSKPVEPGKAVYPFRAANEEVLSTNEELQSVNEELEAAKEELEASNEELIAMNEELKTSNMELAAARDFAENLLETANAIIIILDKEARITNLNQYAQNITGYSRADVLGRNWFDLFIPASDREKIPVVFMDVLNRLPHAFENENTLVTRDGKEILVRWSNNVVKDSFGEITGVLSIGMDITEKKMMEEQFRHSAKMKAVGQLAGGIAHDFNNILHMIIGNTELVMDDVPHESLLHKNLEEIKSAGLRAAGIVSQLLTFSRKAPCELQVVNARKVIEDSLAFLRSSIPSSIEIKQHLAINDVNIMADPVQINQVLINICTNAYQAMEKTGGTLTIKAQKISVTALAAVIKPDLSESDYLEMIISDTGSGIDPAIKDRIFDPYFTTRDFGEGSGFGLAVVQGIVKKHKGAIHVESRQGKGTVFTIYLPVSTGKPAEATVSSPEKMPGGTESILFIDDEPSIIHMIQKVLTRLGYRVTTFPDPEQALEYFSKDPSCCDLVLTDMTMPGMNGIQLTRKIKSLRRDIPVIVCTGHNPEINENIARANQVHALAMKPVSIKALARMIRDALDRKGTAPLQLSPPL